MIKSVPIKDIRIDGNTQQRPVDDNVVKRYAAMMKEGSAFPPVEIITDGKSNFLYDGFHRVAATIRLNKKYIEANIVNGTQRQAMWLSFSTNKENAFPRQPGTAKEIIKKILRDKEWSKTSQRDIGRHVGCTQKFVWKICEEIKKSASDDQSSDRTALSGQKTGIARSKTVNVKRGESEYEMEVPKRKVLDATGKEVPEHLVKYFERANEYRGLVRQVHAVYKVLKDGKESGDQFYRYIDVSDLTARVNNLKHLIKFGMPYAVCGYCGGDEMNAECRACGGSGFVNEGMYKATPRELK